MGRRLRRVCANSRTRGRQRHHSLRQKSLQIITLVQEAATKGLLYRLFMLQVGLGPSAPRQGVPAAEQPADRGRAGRAETCACRRARRGAGCAAAQPRGGVRPGRPGGPPAPGAGAVFAARGFGLKYADCAQRPPRRIPGPVRRWPCRMAVLPPGPGLPARPSPGSASGVRLPPRRGRCGGTEPCGQDG